MVVGEQFFKSVYSCKWAIPYADPNQFQIGTCQESPTFVIGNHVFRLQVYVGGFDDDHKNTIAIFLKKCGGDPVNVGFSLSLNDGYKKVVFKNEICFGKPVTGEDVVERSGSIDCIDRRDHDFQRMILANEGWLIILCDIYGLSAGCSCVGMAQHFGGLRQYLVDGDFSDAIVRVQKMEFRVHKIILCCASDVFAATFQNDMAERRSNLIEIPDHDHITVRDLLEYCYTGDFNCLAKKNVGDLYIVADKYMVQTLKKACEDFLIKDLCKQNVMEMLTFADLYGVLDLRREAMKMFIQYKEELKDYPAFVPFIKSSSVALLKDLL